MSLSALVLVAGAALVARALFDRTWRRAGPAPFIATVAVAGLAGIKLFSEAGALGAVVYLPLLALAAAGFGFVLQGPTEGWSGRTLDGAAAAGVGLTALSLAL